MRKAFMCSLIHRGILGGGLYLDQQAVTFVCNKLTVEQEFKKLSMPFEKIESLTWQQVIFPIAVFQLRSGEAYRFLVFNKKRFMNYYQQYRDADRAGNASNAQ